MRPLRDAGEPDDHGSPGHQDVQGHARRSAAAEAVSDFAVALDAKFYAYGEELERVEVFKYLGRLIVFGDDDTQAVRGNLAKA